MQDFDKKNKTWLKEREAFETLLRSDHLPDESRVIVEAMVEQLRQKIHAAITTLDSHNLIDDYFSLLEDLIDSKTLH